ncbi:hypothetical protein MWG46_13500 [Escherichia coli]|nr:hypothetical protein [Escherichia coli]
MAEPLQPPQAHNVITWTGGLMLFITAAMTYKSIGEFTRHDPSTTIV